MYEIAQCPICYGKKLEEFIRCIDYTVSHETFKIVKCDNCSFLITSPRPDKEALSSYYVSDDYISHTDNTATIIDKTYQFARHFTLAWKLSLVKENAQSTTHFELLDFGCGTGDFLNKAKSKGHRITGVEPSPLARINAERKLNQKIHSSLDEVIGQFDAITLWHVLEHVPDLNETVEQLKHLLSKNGTMFIAVPNHKSPDAQLYQEHWAAYDVPRHLWHFNQKTMTQFLSNHGLHLRNTIPMKLDAFYVSMLSEKYKSGEKSLTGMIKGFVNGFRSNLLQSNKEYSSLIYVVQK